MRKTDFHMQRMKRHEYKIERDHEDHGTTGKDRTGTECKRKQGNVKKHLLLLLLS